MSLPSSGNSPVQDNTRCLVVSFHDLHPGTRTECQRFLDGLAKLGVKNISLLVVPRWHGARPIHEDETFTKWVQLLAGAGHDVCLHGFFHQADSVTGGPLQRFMGRIYTNSEGEFFQISRGEAQRRVADGLEILARQGGFPVVGFTPPAWLINDEARAALVDAGLHYTTTFSGVDLLQRDRQLSAPTIVYSCRNAWRRFVSRIWVRFWSWRNRNAEILRIAAHPGDFADPKVEASLFERIRCALESGRKSTTYRDLVTPRPKPQTVG